MTIHKRFLSALAILALLCCTFEARAEAQYDMNAPQNLAAEHLFAESALLVDQDSGEVLFSKNSRIRMYPASTTKIMTLLLALESDIPLDAQVTIPAEAADIPEGSSVIPVKPGDVVSFSDLLYGFMLSSGNDGANAIAVLVDGSIEAFVARMNQRAAQIGCEGTHYVNAHGYHNAEHYTTAQDLALIARVAMENEDFRKIVAAPKWTMTIQRDGATVNPEIISRNSLLQSGEKYYYPDCTGIKTGHHNKAGWCFVGSAQREGERLICVVLKCEEEMSKWYDAARLFEYGFTRYAPVPVSDLLIREWERLGRIQLENVDPADPEGGSLLLNLNVEEGQAASVQVVANSDLALSAAAQRMAAAAELSWERELTAPVSQGERLGTLSLTLQDGTTVTAALTASRAVAEPAPATHAPTRVPVSTAETSGDSAPARSQGGSGGTLLIIALLAALGAAVAGVALAMRNARVKRERAKRRRRRARPQASRSVAPRKKSAQTAARRRATTQNTSRRRGD